jgi:hypothetical protein
MKKVRIILFALLLGVVPLLAFAGTSYAADFRNGNNVTVQKGETIDHTLFIAGNNVEVDGTVNGDVFCAGQNIIINANVTGDVICGGMNVEIGGTVSGNVRAAGQVVTLTGSVAHNASLVGNTVKVDAASKIEGDLQTAGNVSTINGTVARDVDTAGNTVNLNGAIGRDVQAYTDDLQLQSGAQVSGGVTYYSHNMLTKATGASVTGAVTQKQPQERPKQAETNPVPGIILSLVMLLTLAFALLALFPRKLKNLTDLALTKPGSTVLIGLAVCVGMPVLIIASFITVIGAFVGLTLLFAWIVVMLVSGALASYYTGRLVFMRSAQHPFVVMLTGVLIVSILLIIPIVNILTFIAIALLGSGMVVRYIFAASPAPRYESISHPVKTQKKAN